MSCFTDQLKEKIISRLSLYRRRFQRNRQRSSTTKNTADVSPSPYLDLVSNPFTSQEWNYLKLGPSFIRLNQSVLRSDEQQEIEIRNEHRGIFTKVQNHLVNFYHIPRTVPIFQDYSQQLLDYIRQCYFSSVPYKDRIQAKKYAQIVASTRKKLMKHRLVLRLTDKGHNFYVGSASEFEKKCQQFFHDTNTFMELTENPFDDLLNKVIQLLNSFYYKHIRPIFDKHCYATTIFDGAHFIKRINKYVKNGLFRPTTIFCTFDIHNLYTMLPQDEALNILVEFLHVHGYRKVKGIVLDTIRKLASIVIKENMFVYGKKIYKQTTGGAMGSSFTLTLANLFMWKWQKELVRQHNICGEFFGRYIDDVFMAWNRTEQELRKLLADANQWHPNI
ncbi:unnamed protein product [Adineta ricciae]|nr:unnamed protein product [Adineta ricciae]